MTKYIVFLLLTIYAQHAATFCTGKGYEGYLFDTSYLLLKSIDGQKARANLTTTDIKDAEAILRAKLPAINTQRTNQAAPCPDIEKKLQKYCRQYFGFINDKGEKIVWINLFWNKDLRDRASHDVIMVNDGCSRYWNIEVNLSAGALSHLHINGAG